jgi:hypothetical protein
LPGHELCQVTRASTRWTASILIRPDGYIGLIADADNALAVAGYLRSLQTRLERRRLERC